MKRLFSSTTLFSVKDVYEKTLLAASVAISVFTVIYLYYRCHFGFEFSDEGFYLSWVKDPFYQPSSATQFGFIYSNLYKLSEENLGLYRFLNFIITFMLSISLHIVVLKEVFGRRISKVEVWTSAIGLSCLSATMLVFAGAWLPTPSYNHLALQSLLIAAIGLTTIDKAISRRSMLGWTVLSVGGWMAFMAKPTTAAALAVLSIVYLLISGKLNFRYLAYAVLVSAMLLVMSALWIDGSVQGFVERLRSGSEMYILLGAGHAKLFRYDALSLSADTLRAMWIAICGIVCIVLFLQPVGWALNLLAVCASFCTLAWLGFLILYRGDVVINGAAQGMVVFAIPVASLYIAAALKNSFFVGYTRGTVATGVVFLLFPAAFSFGTNANYWVAAAPAGCFLVLAGLVLLRDLPDNIRIGTVLFPLAIGAQVLGLIQVQTGLENPYRQPQSLIKARTEITLGDGSSKLYVSESFATYIGDAIRLAHESAFAKGTPLIDLTGQSPGTLYVMGAANIGQPWTVGGYPGSADLATVMLGKAPCYDLGRSWLLIEPDGPRSISPTVLSSFGADWEKDYTKMGTLMTTPGVSGSSEIRAQYLLKPRRSTDEASSACLAKRASFQ
jgi:hypothetical protein